MTIPGALGSFIVDTIEGSGQFVRFMGRTLGAAIRGVAPFGRGRLLLPQLYYTGTQSISVITILGFFVGSAIGVEAYSQFAEFGMQSQVGALVALTVVSQVGPVLAATMVAGRAGGRISSELGTMHVTEQLDAMRAIGVDPVAYLVVPRLVACVVMMPILTIFSDLVGVTGGYFVVVWGYHVNSYDYVHAMAHAVTSWDVLTGIFKSLVFGGLVGVTSCYHGFHCRQSARGVGRATTTAFVATFIAIVLADLLLVNVFQQLYGLTHAAPHPTVFS